MATLKKKDQRRAVTSALALAQQIGSFPASKLWLDYDAEADVLAYLRAQAGQHFDPRVVPAFLNLIEDYEPT